MPIVGSMAPAPKSGWSSPCPEAVGEPRLWIEAGPRLPRLLSGRGDKRSGCAAAPEEYSGSWLDEPPRIHRDCGGPELLQVRSVSGDQET